MAIARVKMTSEQYYKALAVTNKWDQDQNLCGLVEMPRTPKEELDKNIVFLKANGAITVPLWEKFCEEIEMRIPFPGY